MIAYQMGATLAHDHLGADRCAELRKSQIILIDCTAGFATFSVLSSSSVLMLKRSLLL